MSGEPMAARTSKETRSWGMGMKVAVGLLCVALLAAGSTGLAIGLSRRSSDKATDTPVASNAGVTSSRDGGSSTISTPETVSTPDDSGSAGSPATPPGGCSSVLDAVNGSPELSMLFSTLQAAGLSETLADTDSTLTLLAPSNSALNSIPMEQLNDVTADQDLLSTILNLHMIPIPVPAASFSDGATIATLAGFLDVSVSDGLVSFTTPDGTASATVTQADIKTCKGYVHIIDSVLIPADLLSDSPVTTLPPGAFGPSSAAPIAAPPVDVLPIGVAPVGAPAAPINTTSPLGIHANGVTRAEDGTYTVCAGRWAPKQFQGPEPCGIRVRSTGVVNVGSEFGGVNGVFSAEASDGEDNSCFKESLARMFGQKLCAFNAVSGGIACLPEADGSLCVCLAPFGQPYVKENNRKWEGNIGFDRFLKILRSRAKLEAGDVDGNKFKLELTLQKLLKAETCAIE